MNKEELKEYHKKYYDKNRKRVSARSKQWYQNNKEHARIRNHQYYLKNKEQIKKRTSNYRKNNPEKSRLWAKRHQLKHSQVTRKEIIELLGGKCVNPFNIDHGDFATDDRCLEIDHINNGGSKERSQFSTHKQYMDYLLREIKAGNKNYQLLCSNCNALKQRKRYLMQVEERWSLCKVVD